MPAGIEIILIFFYFLVFALILQSHPFFKLKELPKNFLLMVFLIKILSGIVLAVIYTHYYPRRMEADIFKYFDDSKYLYDAIWTKPVDFFKMMFGIGNDTEYYTAEYYSKMNNWFRQYESNIYNDSHTIIRFNALLRFFSFGFYHVHTVFMCFISLIGIVAFYKAIVPYFIKKERILALLLFLIPSVIFWSSGVLKEGLLVFGIGVLIYCCFEFMKGNYRWYYFPVTLIVLFLLMYLKVYSLMLLLPCLFAFWLNGKFSFKYQLVTYFTTFLIAFVGALNLHHIKPDYNILEIITHKQHDFINHAEHLGSGSIIKIDPVEPSVTSFLTHSPEAFFNAFFRPFVLESSNPMMWVSGLENLAFLILLILAFLKLDKLNKEQLNLLWFLVFYLVTMFVLVGLVTPVMGAMVRYKVPALGMLAGAIILLGNWKLVFNNYPKLKKLLKLS